MAKLDILHKTYSYRVGLTPVVKNDKILPKQGDDSKISAIKERL